MIHLPLALIHSPTSMRGTLPITATVSRKPRALTFRTQNPDSSLWNVISSTNPSRDSSCSRTMEAGRFMGSC